MFRLAICSAGVYSMFLVWAIAQESLSSTFDAPLFLQLTQSILSALAAYVYLVVVTKQPPSFPTNNLRAYILVALCITLSPVFAFASLRHISYPTMVLAKSCKLIPTILINVLLYRSKFKLYKYCVVLTVTFGITVFMYQAPSTPPSSSARPLYLLINLLLDGLTNSTQDSLFAANPSLTASR
jgi:UDP-galactose transporter B1